jgi:hypothetical protein
MEIKPRSCYLRFIFEKEIEGTQKSYFLGLETGCYLIHGSVNYYFTMLGAWDMYYMSCSRLRVWFFLGHNVFGW